MLLELSQSPVFSPRRYLKITHFTYLSFIVIMYIVDILIWFQNASSFFVISFIMLFFYLMCTDISNLHEDNWCRSCKLDWKIWWNGMPTCSSWAGERLPSNSCRDSLWCCNSLCSSLCCTDSI